jgi:hypothetical protein
VTEWEERMKLEEDEEEKQEEDDLDFTESATV